MSTATYNREPVLSDDTAGGSYGDYAVGTAYEGRYVARLDDDTFAVVTVAYFIEDDWLLYPDRERDAYHFDIRERVEWMRCRDADDPGGTEIWCDYDYDNPHPYGFADLTEAERQCKRMADEDFHRYFTWNGELHA